jgi:hypothetical protein
MAGMPPAKAPAKEHSGLRYPANGKTIYHRPLNRTKTAELSQASFAYLFSEMVSYAQRRVTGIQDLEKRFVIPASLANVCAWAGGPIRPRLVP